MPISINGTTGISGVDGSAGTPALQGSDTNTGIAFGSDVIIGSTGGTERFRCDNSGRLLVGTSSSVYSSSLLTVKGGISTSVGDVNIASTVANITSGNDIGAIRITNTNGWRGAQILATADGNWTEGSSQPTLLSFGTTASGASSPTERLRIANNGQLSAVVPGNSTLYPGFMARAWVNFNGTGTVNIRGSGNVSSITDNGVGDYYINYTTAMPDGNYSGITNNDWYGLGYLDSYNTTSVHLVTLDNNWTKRDINVLSVAIFR